MGLLRDIRSGRRDQWGLGADAIVFWLLAGLAVGAGCSYGVGGSEKFVLAFGFTGGVVGLCLGFYAAMGVTRLAKALALPGALIAILH